MTFCHNCGLKLTLGDEKFSPHCGIRLQLIKTTVDQSNGIQHTAGDVNGAGISGSGNVIGKEVFYSVQGDVYNIINGPQEVQEGFRKINTISTQLDIAPASPQLHHGTITTGVIEKTQEIAVTRRVANQFLDGIGRIEKCCVGVVVLCCWLKKANVTTIATTATTPRCKMYLFSLLDRYGESTHRFSPVMI